MRNTLGQGIVGTAAFVLVTLPAITTSADSGRTPGSPAITLPGSGQRQESGVAVSFLGLESRVPADWVRHEPDSSMRLVQFEVPSGEGADAAEVVVYYFGPGQGGDFAANLDRWKSQFSGPEGGSVEPRVTRFEVAGIPVSVAELEGTYTRGVGMGAAGPARPDQTLVAAVVETERGSLFIQLHGPRDIVAANHDEFDAFLRGLRPIR